MATTVTFNGTEEIGVSRLTITGAIPMDERWSAGASGLQPTAIEIEREMTSETASEDFFNAAVAPPGSANEATLECELEVGEETAYGLSVEEGTVVGWRLSQEEDGAIIETTTVLARKAELEADGGAADLTIASSR